MIKVIIIAVILIGLGFTYGRNKGLWDKTVDFFRTVVEKVKNLINRRKKD